MPLNPKQRAFVANYAGNATEAAIKAGYSKKTAKSQGQRLLTHVDIARAIQSREETRTNKAIMDREERQAFWSSVARGEHGEGFQDMKDRLRASELLGKSEADFVDRVQSNIDIRVNVSADEMTDDELAQVIARGNGKS